MDKTIVFTFGRLAPPTIGHQRLISKVIEVARLNKADHSIYLSQTQDTIKNPLSWDFKCRVCESAFKGVVISRDPEIKTPFMALNSFINNYKNVILVVGQDQVNEFQERMTPYAESKGFNFSIISSGDRIADSDDIEGISASKMRQYAREKNKKLFLENLPTTLTSGIKELIYSNTRRGLKI